MYIIMYMHSQLMAGYTTHVGGCLLEDYFFCICLPVSDAYNRGEIHVLQFSRLHYLVFYPLCEAYVEFRVSQDKFSCSYK